MYPQHMFLLTIAFIFKLSSNTNLTCFRVNCYVLAGDGYMVASGLPVRNGDKHVSEIALLALDLRDTMAELEIPHLNNEKFRLRIGFNTGNACVYCLSKGRIYIEKETLTE